jgi:hypothetical protein
VVGLPDPLIVLLKTHKEAQDAERTAATVLAILAVPTLTAMAIMG